MMMMMYLLQSSLFLAALLSKVVTAQRFEFDLKAGTVRDIDGTQQTYHRDLQNTIYPPDGWVEGCRYRGPRLECTETYLIPSSNGVTAVYFTAECDGNSNSFDFRNPDFATNCQCRAILKEAATGDEKRCPCQVCAENLGENPVFVDCSANTPPPSPPAADDTGFGSSSGTATEANEQDTGFGGSGTVTLEANEQDTGFGGSGTVTLEADEPDTGFGGGATTEANEQDVGFANDPFIINSCTSLDCRGYCNATCSLNCGEENPCDFCANHPDNIQPTDAPEEQGVGVNSAAACFGSSVGMVSAVLCLGTGLAVQLLQWV